MTLAGGGLNIQVCRAALRRDAPKMPHTNPGTDRAPDARRRPTLAAIATGSLLLVLAAAVTLFAIQSLEVIRFPFPIDYGEGPLLDQVVRLERGDNIYDRDLSTPPYTIANYPPGYLLLQVPWVRVFGPAFWYGRLTSAISLVVAALAVGALLQRLTARRSAAIAGGALLLAMPYTTYWAPLFRIDAAALATSLLALFLVVRWPDRATALAGAACLLTLAVYVRQSYGLAAPCAAFVWLFSRPGSRRCAFWLAGGVAGLGAALFTACDLATGGGFRFHLVTANLNAFSLGRTARYLAELLWLLPVPVALAALFVLAGRRAGRDTWTLVVPYLVGASLAAVTIGKTGSNVNYLLELCAALALATGGLLAAWRGRPLLQPLVTLALLAQVSLLLGGTRYRDHVRSVLDQQPVFERLLEVVHETEGKILADEAAGLLPLDGRPIHAQPFELTQLAQRGDWDPAPLLDELERREFSAVLVHRVPWSAIHRTRWTPEMLRRIEHGYDATATIGYTVVYRPKPPRIPDP